MAPPRGYNINAHQHKQCGFCGKRLPTTAGVKRHIRQSDQCGRAWEAWIVTMDASAAPAGPQVDITAPASAADQPLEPPFDELEGADIVNDAPADNEQNPYRARVEDVPDADELVRWVRAYPGPAGEVLGSGECTFERWRRENREAGRPHWHPFTSEKEWELGRWLAKNVGQNQIEEFLKLTVVSGAYLIRFLARLIRIECV